LRRLPKPDGVSLVTAGPTHVSLPPWVGVDLWEAQARLDARPADGDADPAGSQDAHLDPELLQADVLPEWLDDWLVTERERHRQLRLHALERLCGEHRDQGRYDLAIRAGLTAVAGEPLRESAHRALIEVHLAEGNHAEALRQYQGYRHRLREELGLAPSPVIRALVAPLLGRPADVRAPRGRRAGSG
jgi:DNA-binding SARP family transcriptional activator